MFIAVLKSQAWGQGQKAYRHTEEQDKTGLKGL